MDTLDYQCGSHPVCHNHMYVHYTCMSCSLMYVMQSYVCHNHMHVTAYIIEGKGKVTLHFLYICNNQCDPCIKRHTHQGTPIKAHPSRPTHQGTTPIKAPLPIKAHPSRHIHQGTSIKARLQSTPFRRLRTHKNHHTSRNSLSAF